MLSVVIPVFNEAPAIPRLYEELHWVLAYTTPSGSPSRMEGEKQHNVSPPPSRRGGEGGWSEGLDIIFVDDGSTDGTWGEIAALADRDRRVTGVRLRRNSGKAVAYAAGFATARGDLLATLDGDLQDDPAELPMLLARLDERDAPDVIVGWKRERNDATVKVWSSHLFNRALNRVSGTALHDQNSGFRVLRHSVVDAIPLRGDLYRMIPALAAMHGFRVVEVPVRHRSRAFGASKYGRTGLRRMFRGAFDLMTIAFLVRFRNRPFHFFASLGGALVLVGLAVNAYLSVLWLGGQSIGTRPLLALGVLAMIVGVQLISTGFLADLVILGREREEPPPIAEVRHSRNV